MLLLFIKKKCMIKLHRNNIFHLPYWQESTCSIACGWTSHGVKAFRHGAGETVNCCYLEARKFRNAIKITNASTLRPRKACLWIWCTHILCARERPMPWLFFIYLSTPFPFSVLFHHAFSSRKLTSIHCITQAPLPCVLGWVNGGIRQQEEFGRKERGQDIYSTNSCLDKSDSGRDCIFLSPQLMSNDPFNDYSYHQTPMPPLSQQAKCW